MSGLAGKFGTMQIGAKYNVTLPTYSDLDQTELQADDRGRLIVAITSIAGSGIATETTLASVLAAVDGLEALETSIDGKMTSLLSQTDGIEGSLTTLVNQTDGVETSLSSIDGKVLTDTQLRASPVPVSGPLTDTELRATPVPVSGPVTDAQIRATPLPVSGPLTDTELRASAVPVSMAAHPKGRTIVTKVRNDYGSINVTTAAYTQLIASLGAEVEEIEIFDSSGRTLVLAIGAAASEVDQLYIVPGGNGRIPFKIAAGTRVAIKAVSANATAGEISANFYGV